MDANTPTSFRETRCANGNVNIVFFQGNKKRNIILAKDSQALREFQILAEKTIDIKPRIQMLKSNYTFKANDNNPSIFRPIQKQ